MRLTAVPFCSVLVVVALVVLSQSPLAAQSIQGSVVDASNDRPVLAAFVRMISEDDSTLAVSISDSAGCYSLDGFGPGRFRISVQRQGYDSLTSQVLSVTSASRTYPLDILLQPDPTEVGGFVVSADRVNSHLTSVVGLNPRSLRTAPIDRARLDREAERGRNLVDLVRWLNVPSIDVVERGDDGPCFRYRAYNCLPVFLDGIVFSDSFVSMLALDALESVVVLHPNESVAYPNGALLLLTRGSIR